MDDSGSSGAVRAKLRLSGGLPGGLIGSGGHGATEVQRALKSFPLSEGQKALWSIQQSNPATTIYHVPVAAFWDEPLDLAALKEAWQQLVQEQPALRATFRFDVTEPIQMIQEARPVMIHRENLFGLADSEIIRRIGEVSRQPFDLDRDPLWRVDAFLVSSTRNILLFSLHHLVFDGHSLAGLVEQPLLLSPDVCHRYIEPVNSTPKRLHKPRQPSL